MCRTRAIRHRCDLFRYERQTAEVGSTGGEHEELVVVAEPAAVGQLHGAEEVVVLRELERVLEHAVHPHVVAEGQSFELGRN